MAEESASGGRRASWGRDGEQSVGRKRDFEDSNDNAQDNKKSRKDRDEDVYGPCNMSSWVDIKEYDDEKNVEWVGENEKIMAKQYGDLDEDVYGPREMSSWADIKEYDDEQDSEENVMNKQYGGDLICEGTKRDFEESKDNVEYNKKPYQDRDEDVYGPCDLSSWADIKEYDDEHDAEINDKISLEVHSSSMKHPKKKYLSEKKQNGGNDSRPDKGRHGRGGNRRDRNEGPKGIGSEPCASNTRKLYAGQKRDKLKENRCTNVPQNIGRTQETYLRDPYDRAPYGRDHGRDDPYARDNPYSREEQYGIGPDDPYRLSHEDPYSKGPEDHHGRGLDNQCARGGRDYSYGRSLVDPYALGGRDDSYRQNDPYGRDRQDDPYVHGPYSRGDPYTRDHPYAHDSYARDSYAHGDPYARGDPYACGDPYARDIRKDPCSRDRGDESYALDRRDDPYATDRRDDPYVKDRRDGSNAKDRRDGPYTRDRREVLYGRGQDDTYPDRRDVHDRLGRHPDDLYKDRRDVRDRLGRHPDDRYPFQHKKPPPRKVHGTSKDDYRRTHRLR